MGYFKMALANLIPLLFKASSEGQDSEIALCRHAIWPRIVKCTRSINPLNRCKSNSEAWPRYPWMYEPHSCKSHVNHAWWVQKHASANVPQMLNWFALPEHFSNTIHTVYCKKYTKAAYNQLLWFFNVYRSVIELSSGRQKTIAHYIASHLHVSSIVRDKILTFCYHVNEQFASDLLTTSNFNNK